MYYENFVIDKNEISSSCFRRIKPTLKSFEMVSIKFDFKLRDRLIEATADKKRFPNLQRQNVFQQVKINNKCRIGN